MSWNILPWSNRRKKMVGITSRSHEGCFQWLEEFVRKYSIEVIRIPITNSNRYVWEEKVRECSAVILYHTKHQGRVNVTDVDGALYDDELSYLNHQLGREKVVVIVDDMEDVSEDERQRILKTQPSLERLSSQLILIPEKYKTEAATRRLEEFVFSKGGRTAPREENRACAQQSYSSQTSGPSRRPKNINTEEDRENSSSNSSSSRSSAPSKPRPAPHSTYRVGIFSRSTQSNYTWLMHSLQKDRHLRSAEIGAFFITNHYETFRSGLRQCHLAILYHTRKQGRINITDVTDSLYDEELREMSEYLGREKVVVIVDDMEDASEDERQRILKTQPSLERLSSQLILIPKKYKTEAATRRLEELFSVFSKGGRTAPREENGACAQQSYSSQTSGPSQWPKNINTEEDRENSSSNSSSIRSSAPSKPRPAPHSTYRVGIFSRSAQSNYTWLMNSLQKDRHLRSAEIGAFYVSNNYQIFRSGLRQCHFAILYHTKNQGRLNITDVTDALYDEELREMSEYLGKENVIVVADDLESSGPEAKDWILDKQFSIRKYAKNVFLFTETNKHTKNVEEIQGIIKRRVWTPPWEKGGASAQQSSPSLSSGPRSLSWTSSKTRPPPHSTYRIGIFSRSAQSNYTWLMDSLQEGHLRSAEIGAFYVSNNYETFRSGLRQCHFAILYHTKNQGRLNITDVTDSLYDEELREMSEYLGKENVIVVVDDLESSGPEAKDWILANQFSIRKYAKNLFLFTETNKLTKNVVEIRGIIEQCFAKYLARFNVLDTARKAAPHRDGESSKTEPGSSADSPDNRTAQDKDASSALSPSTPQSDHRHLTDNTEPQPKRSRTSSSEDTDSMDVKGLREPSSSDFLHAMKIKWEKLQKENEGLKKENLFQKETIKKLKNKNTALSAERDTRNISIEKEITQNIEEHQTNMEEQEAMTLEREGGVEGQEEIRDEERTSQEEETQEENTGTKTSFLKGEEHRTQPREQERLPQKEECLQSTAGARSLEDLTMEELMIRLQEMIKEKDLHMQRQGEEIQRKGEEIQRKGEEIQKQGEEIQRKGLEIKRQGEEILKKKKGMQSQGEGIKKKGEGIKKKGEEIQRKGEEIQRRGNEIKHGGKEIQRQEEVIQSMGEEIQKQINEIADFETICNVIKGENEWKVQ